MISCRKARYASAIATLIVGVALSHAQSNSPLRLESTVPLPDVKGRIDHLAFDADDERLFVAALGNNTVEVIDVKSAKVIRTITGWLTRKA
jgi:YVTN family beta-propeller protein